MSKLLIVDLSYITYRGYFGQGINLKSSDGTPTKAVYNGLQWLLSFYKLYKPTHIIFAIDDKTCNLERTKRYPDYKAGRNKAIDPQAKKDIIKQKEMLEDFCSKLTKTDCIVKVNKYEADDIIASSVCKFTNKVDEICIVASDKDLYQLLFDRVFIYNPTKEQFFTKDNLLLEKELLPEQITLYQALIGDTADNIKGVAGIGPKSAVTLIKDFYHVDDLLNNIDSIDNSKIKDKILKDKDSLKLSEYLVTLECDLPLAELETYKIETLDFEAIEKDLYYLDIVSLSF